VNAMNAALPIPTIIPAPRGAIWYTPDEAARRLGVSVRRIRQLAAKQWLAWGLAEILPREGDGVPTLHIRSDAHPLLSRAVAPELPAVDLRTLTKEQRAAFLKSKELYLRWRGAIDDPVNARRAEAAITDDLCARVLAEDGTLISARSLRRLHLKIGRMGERAFLDGRSVKPDEARDAADVDPFLEDVKRLYLDQRRMTKRVCYRLAEVKAIEEGWELPSYRTVCRMLDRIPPATVALYRRGEDAYANEASAFIQRDYSTIDSNDLWVFDHHRLDVLCAADAATLRPWFSAAMDMRSRLIVGWALFAHDPNEAVIRSVFRSGCMRHGVPRAILCDNGLDYTAASLHGVTKAERRQRDADDPAVRAGLFAQLGCEVHLALPYNAKAKTIERFFGTMADQFSRMQPTYCGNSPAEKPENLPDRLARGAAPTVAELAARFGDWLVFYHNQPHTGHAMNGATPLQAYEANLKSKRTAPEGLLDLLFLRQSKSLKVGRVGVSYRGLTFGARELAGWFGKTVTIRVDDADLRSVLIFDEMDNFLTIARCNERLPVLASDQELRAAMAQKGRERKIAREAHGQRMRMSDTPADRMLRNRIKLEREAKPPAGPGPSLAAINSPMASQLPAIDRTREILGIRSATDAGQRRESDSLASVDPLRHYKSKAFSDEDDGDDASRAPTFSEVMRERERTRRETA
jgi:transposase InsO family protein